MNRPDLMKPSTNGNRSVGIQKLQMSVGFLLLVAFGWGAYLIADPCGMVPPIYTGNQVPITRVGLQQTYVFHDQGMESFVIRPGFEGNIDNFGMLIPFPNPPSIRKVPDNVFQQIKNAIDPPEVITYVHDVVMESAPKMRAGGLDLARAASTKDKVKVLKREAVGMYEVAVLAAGSAEALKKWMKQNRYQYPVGMDTVANEYIEQKWCFVAVKTKVQDKGKVDPKPGQRRINSNLEKGDSFTGHVQGLGFRFRSKELVVPMRLSAFNEGDMRNIVYLLTRGPRKIRFIPEEYVVRQINGKELIKNLTRPLPLRVIGGTLADLSDQRKNALKIQRRPGPKNGVAKVLFTSDVHSAATAQASGQFNDQSLLLKHEAIEKELLAIGEHLALRGPKLDAEIATAIRSRAEAETEARISDLRDFTLTVVDGDFPREILANQNLTFANFEMPVARNSSKFYDAKIHRPAPNKQGKLYSAAEPWNQINTPESTPASSGDRSQRTAFAMVFTSLLTALGLLFIWKQ